MFEIICIDRKILKKYKLKERDRDRKMERKRDVETATTIFI